MQRLRDANAGAPDAASALELARGAWQCGDYDEALEAFRQARALAPDAVECHLALLNATALLGLRTEENETLVNAVALSPDDPWLNLHAARRMVPHDLAGARRQLLPFAAHPLSAEFLKALGEILDAPATDRTHAPLAHSYVNPRARARAEGLHWVRTHADGPEVYAGFPVDVLQRALAAAPADGLTLECGVYFGRSLRLLAAGSSGRVDGFDSFEGLPEAWSASEQSGAYSTAGKRPAVAANVQLHAGWFEDTLPAYFAENSESVRLLHVDCDLYSSTRTVLEAADRHLVAGSVIVFDDLLGYPGYAGHELRAFGEWATARHVGWTMVAATLLGREVAIRITRR